MLSETQKALLAYVGTGGKTPEQMNEFLGDDDRELQALIEAGYVVLNGTAPQETPPNTGQAPESVLAYALTYAGTLEMPQQ
jgi:hypothetical protein